MIDEENNNNARGIRDATIYEYVDTVADQPRQRFHWLLRACHLMGDYQMYGPLTRDIKDHLDVGSKVYIYQSEHLSKNDPVHQAGFDLVPHTYDQQYFFGGKDFGMGWIERQR